MEFELGVADQHVAPASAAGAVGALDNLWGSMRTIEDRFGKVEGLNLWQLVDRAYLVPRALLVKSVSHTAD